MFKGLKEKKFIITENASVEIEKIKNNQIKILKLRNTVSDMKMSLDGLNNILGKAVEKVSKLVDL